MQIHYLYTNILKNFFIKNPIILKTNTTRATPPLIPWLRRLNGCSPHQRKHHTNEIIAFFPYKKDAF